MKRKLIMNLQLCGFGQMARPFFEADGGAGKLFSADPSDPGS